MNSRSENRWPSLELDPVERLYVVAAGLPHVAIEETTFDAPIERVWGLVGDLEDGVRQFERAVSSAKIERREGDLLDLVVRTPLGARLAYRVELSFGWCLMQARHSQIGMAAAPTADGAHTRFAHFEGSSLLGRLARPLLRWNIRGDFVRIAERVR